MTPARSLVAALLFLTAVPVVAGAEPSVACPSRVSTTADGWRRVAAPAFPAGGKAIVAYAVMPDRPETALVSNGTTVLLTRDDGCTWAPSYTVPDSLLTFTTVLDVVAAKTRQYILLDDNAGPKVMVSANGGTTWQAANIPVLTNGFGGAVPRLATDASGKYAYVTVRTAGFTGGADLLYVTEDGGATWDPRPIGFDQSYLPPPTVEDVAVDPLLGTDVWATSQGGVVRSGDAGKSWTPVNVGAGTGFGAISISHRADAPVFVVIASSWDSVVYLRRPGGGWTAVNTPGQVTSVAPGRTTEQVAVTMESGAYELDFGALTWSPMHRGNPVLSRLSSDDTSAASYHACACDDERAAALWRRTPRTFASRNRGTDRGAENPGIPGFDGCAPSGKQPDPVDFGPSEIAGRTEEINVAPGKSVKVPFTFRVQPRTLEVFFLMDTGQRFYRFNCLAKQGAIWAAYELAKSRNLRVGLGEYHDYLITGKVELPTVIGDCLVRVRQDFVYRRDLRIGAVDTVFKDAVSGLTGGYEHCSTDHAALPALLQVATGIGQDVAPKGPSPSDIGPGQDAVFSPDAYKVVLHVAGGYFNRPARTQGYPGPEFGQVNAALRDAGIKLVGVNFPYVASKKHHEGQPDPPEPPEETGEADLRIVAEATGSRAAVPVDCGNKTPSRVAVGEALVCTYVDAGRPAKNAPPMGSLMVDLMNGLQDQQPMGLAVLSGNAKLAAVAPAATTRLDHLRAQSLPYTVTFSCAPSEQGLVKQVRLGGLVGTSVAASRTVNVRCGAPPPLHKPYLPPPPPIAHIAGTAAAPVANTNLAPNTAPQPNAQPQHLAQGAMSTQEDSQQQLAYSDVRLPTEDEELAMSALPRPALPPPWAMAEAAALFTVAASWAVASRRRTAIQLSRGGRARAGRGAGPPSPSAGRW